jgi:hypothetical protein
LSSDRHIYYEVYNELGHGFLESANDLFCKLRVLELRIELFHYLRATDYEVGLLLNFGGPRPQFKRAAFDNSAKKPRAFRASSNPS